jgi:hypothetical protein
MANLKKCANMTCTCLAPEKKKYCSDHCEGIGNRIEIICLCGHADCGVTAIQSTQQTSDSQANANTSSARF